MRKLILAAALALAACHPSLPDRADPDAGSENPPADAADAMPPIEPPSTAMETVSAAGHLTQGAFTFDVQLGGVARGRATAGTQTLDTAPVLH